MTVNGGIKTDQFTHDGKLYDLAKIRVMMRSEKAFFLPIDKLLWVLKYDKPDENRVFHAKFRHPLLVTHDGDRWTVVDGLHRLERYRRRGITAIPVKQVTDEMLAAALVT
jgi:hypothetical protein